VSVFKGKTHNLKTQKYDVSMTSLKAKKIFNFHADGILVVLNIP